MQDIKFKKLVKMGMYSFPLYWTAWCIMLDCASEKGGVVPMNDDDEREIIFEMLDCELSEIKNIIRDMEDVGLITTDLFSITVKNWEKYQISDYSTTRVQKHREDVKNKEKVDEVIKIFNELTGKRYSFKTEANRLLISGRLNDGVTVDEIRAVIVARIKKWGNDPKMKEFIRPSTIFAPTNFDKYLNEIPQDILQASSEGTLIKVRDMYGNTKHVTQEQFDKAADGFFTEIK